MKEILLVDDDSSFLTVIQYFLRKYGYQVTTCSSGEDAIELLRSDDFSLVISDLKMGKISGIRVAKAALEKNPPIPVLILTAYAEGLSNAFDKGFWGKHWKLFPNRVLSKPVDETILITAIRNLGINNVRGAMN
jgi:CheY-like chemotaxis protein